MAEATVCPLGVTRGSQQAGPAMFEVTNSSPYSA